MASRLSKLQRWILAKALHYREGIKPRQFRGTRYSYRTAPGRKKLVIRDAKWRKSRSEISANSRCLKLLEVKGLVSLLRSISGQILQVNLTEAGKILAHSLPERFLWGGNYIFERDGYRCFLCGITKDELEKKRADLEATTKRYAPYLTLHLHHQREDKRIIEERDAVTLCYNCHILGNQSELKEHVGSLLWQRFSNKKVPKVIRD